MKVDLTKYPNKAQRIEQKETLIVWLKAITWVSCGIIISSLCK